MSHRFLPAISLIIYFQSISLAASENSHSKTDTFLKEIHSFLKYNRRQISPLQPFQNQIPVQTIITENALCEVPKECVPLISNSHEILLSELNDPDTSVRNEYINALSNKNPSRNILNEIQQSIVSLQFKLLDQEFDDPETFIRNGTVKALSNDSTLKNIPDETTKSSFSFQLKLLDYEFDDPDAIIRNDSIKALSNDSPLEDIPDEIKKTASRTSIDYKILDFDFNIPPNGTGAVSEEMSLIKKWNHNLQPVTSSLFKMLDFEIEDPKYISTPHYALPELASFANIEDQKLRPASSSLFKMSDEEIDDPESSIRNNFTNALSEDVSFTDQNLKSSLTSLFKMSDEEIDDPDSSIRNNFKEAIFTQTMNISNCGLSPTFSCVSKMQDCEYNDPEIGIRKNFIGSLIEIKTLFDKTPPKIPKPIISNDLESLPK